MGLQKTSFINRILDIEGGYVNNPDDSGGETNHGITEKVARRFGYQGHMESMPRKMAFHILTVRYWDAMNLDEVSYICADITRELADTGVNCGTHRAAEWLQRSLNVLNQRGVIYPDLKTDGSIGPITIKALRKHMEHRENDSTVLHRMLNALQGCHYITLAERRAKDEAFIYGWFQHRVI